MRFYLIIPIIILYFAVSWFFPWDIWQGKSTISISYIWDVLFVGSIIFLYRIIPKLGNFQGIIPRIIATIGLGFFSLFIAKVLSLSAPFKYIEHIVIQLLVLAPIVEEFVFRFAFMGMMEKFWESRKKIFLFNSCLFSLSHAPAIWYLPKEFHPFIYWQIVYTFALGWLLAKAKVRSGGIVEPMLLHFSFNLIFYFGVNKGWI